MKITKHLSHITTCLKHNAIDGWLLYSFQKMNTIAEDLVGPIEATRRWYVYVDQEGTLSMLVHDLERTWFEKFAIPIITFTSFSSLKEKLQELTGGAKKIAMEYSPMNEIPYISKVDAGTIELLRHLGIEVVSSAELVQLAYSLWGGNPGVASHTKALSVLHESFELGCREIRKAIDEHGQADEYLIQQKIMESFESRGMMTDHPIIVATAPNNSSPHYTPEKDNTSPINENSLVLFDLWCKEKNDGNAIYADITWMGFAGKVIPDEIQQVWEAVRDARDAGLECVRTRFQNKEPIMGWEVDQATRNVIISRGYEKFFIHRTGHSIQHEVHAAGVNMDNFELRDTRKIIHDCGFSIEPGIYLPGKFGIRSEIDVYISVEGVPMVCGDIQKEIVCF